MHQNQEKNYFVRDDGAEFDMSYGKICFKFFPRLDSTYKFPGIGIRLATVQKAIHCHGIRLWLEAAIKQGATFYFKLPTLFHSQINIGV